MSDFVEDLFLCLNDPGLHTCHDVYEKLDLPSVKSKVEINKKR